MPSSRAQLRSSEVEDTAFVLFVILTPRGNPDQLAGWGGLAKNPRVSELLPPIRAPLVAHPCAVARQEPASQRALAVFSATEVYPSRYRSVRPGRSTFTLIVWYLSYFEGGVE